MVDLKGTSTVRAANSGTLTVEIHLSPDAPQEVIQQIQALVVDSPSDQEIPRDQPGVVDGKYRPMLAASSYSSVNVQPRLILKTVPLIEFEEGKSSLGFGLRNFLFAAGVIYYVIGTAVDTVEWIEKLQPHIEKTIINDLVVPLDEVKKVIQGHTSSTITLRITPQTEPEVSKSERLKRAATLASEIAKFDGVASAKSYEQFYKSEIPGLDPAVIVAVITVSGSIVVAVVNLLTALRKDRDKGNHQTSRIEIHNSKIENLYISVNNDNEAEKLKDIVKALEKIEKDQ